MLPRQKFDNGVYLGNNLRRPKKMPLKPQWHSKHTAKPYYSSDLNKPKPATMAMAMLMLPLTKYKTQKDSLSVFRALSPMKKVRILMAKQTITEKIVAACIKFICLFFRQSPSYRTINSEFFNIPCNFGRLPLPEPPPSFESLVFF